MSARHIALVEAFDGPPRRGMAETTSVQHPILLSILSQIAPEFTPLVEADGQRLLETATVCVNELFRRAKGGDHNGVRRLFQTASHATSMLDKLADCQFDAVRQVARLQSHWPIAMSLRPELRRLVETQLRRLELGTGCREMNIKASGRWTIKTEATQQVGLLYAQAAFQRTVIEGVQADGIQLSVGTLHRWYQDLLTLPPLSRASADEWFEKAIWPLLMNQTGGHPERDQRLRRLGEFRSKHTGTAEPNSGTVEADIRDGIRARLRQALRSMAG